MSDRTYYSGAGGRVGRSGNQRLVHYSDGQIVDQLVQGYWKSVGEKAHVLTPDKNGFIYYSAEDTNQAQRKIIQSALKAWENVSVLKFKQVDAKSNQKPQISFGDDEGGAWTQIGTDKNKMITAHINVEKNWNMSSVSLNSYWLETYIHEIGHALGLGHGGNYNGDATWSEASYLNDTTLFSVMSYFRPKTEYSDFLGVNRYENPNYTASGGYIATPMLIDILAVQKLYGNKVKNQEGDTVYGHHNTVGGYLGKLFAAWFDGVKAPRDVWLDNNVIFTLFDTGGYDVLDFGMMKFSQKINLNQGAFSSVGEYKNNMVIARNTIIESAIGGNGNDHIIGNSYNNLLAGGAGHDHLKGGNGNDTLRGDWGNDILDGGNGFDFVTYSNEAVSVRVDLMIKSPQNTNAGSDWLISIENIVGSAKNDILKGSDKTNILIGGGGNDVLLGRSGHDVLKGGPGMDYLNGGNGYDILEGGAGADIFVFNGGKDVITDFMPHQDYLKIDRKVLKDGFQTVDDFMKNAVEMGDDLVLYFSSGHRLIFKNGAHWDDISDHISII